MPALDLALGHRMIRCATDMPCSGHRAIWPDPLRCSWSRRTLGRMKGRPSGERRALPPSSMRAPPQKYQCLKSKRPECFWAGHNLTWRHAPAYLSRLLSA
jgi:hypothetical protein